MNFGDMKIIFSAYVRNKIKDLSTKERARFLQKVSIINYDNIANEQLKN